MEWAALFSAPLRLPIKDSLNISHSNEVLNLNISFFFLFFFKTRPKSEGVESNPVSPLKVVQAKQEDFFFFCILQWRQIVGGRNK